VGQPISNIAGQNQADPTRLPLIGQWLDPRFQLPYTMQTAFGWSHELMTNTVFSLDYVNNLGRDLASRPRINVLVNGVRRLSFVPLQPQAISTRPAISEAKSKYNALIVGVQRRMTNGLQLTGSYTLASARSQIGTAVDELNQSNLIDATQLYDDPRTYGPTSRTDARHSGTFTAVWQPRWGLTIAPIFLFRTALPVSITEGLDLNSNGERNDLPAKAYAFDGIGKAPKEIGDCETWNCGRGAARTQMNLRVSKSFSLFRSAQLEAIAEVFNLFNAKNPNTFVTGRLLGDGTPAANFLQPNEFAGDFQNPEQRVGQIGFRFTF
jgi:hypothetical protein